MVEILKSVRSLVNNTILDFTIVELTTDKTIHRVVFRYKPEMTNRQGITYRYTDNIYNYCKRNNINTSLYDYSDCINTLPVNKAYPMEIFSIDVYNSF